MSLSESPNNGHPQVPPLQQTATEILTTHKQNRTTTEIAALLYGAKRDKAPRLHPDFNDQEFSEVWRLIPFE